MLSVCAADERRLNCLLPLDVWCMVLKDLEKSDKASLNDLYNCSLFFNEILGKRRTQFLFGKTFDTFKDRVDWKNVKPKVVTRTSFLDNQSDARKLRQTKEDKRDKNNTDSDSNVDDETGKECIISPDAYICDTCGRQIKITWATNILNLRFVCKTWKFGVDAYYIENAAEEAKWLSLNKNSINVDMHFSKTHYKNSTNNFVNPFLYRSAEVEVGEHNYEFAICLGTLKRYGKYFNELDIILLRSQFEYIVGFPNFQSILANVPNLKYLAISGYDNNWLDESKLQLDISLPELEFVQAVDSYKANSIRYILSIAPNITNLELSTEDDIFSYRNTGTPCSPEFHNLANLIHLRTELTSKMNKCLFDCARFKFLQSLDLIIKPCKFYLRLHSIFAQISHTWHDTLEKLTLKYDKNSSFVINPTKPHWNEKFALKMYKDSLSSYCLNFAKLKHFKMTVYNCVVSTNMLYSVKKTLEEANIKINFTPGNHFDDEKLDKMLAEERINFYKIVNSEKQREITKNELWNSFPRLKNIYYELKMCNSLNCYYSKGETNKRNLQCKLARY